MLHGTIVYLPTFGEDVGLENVQFYGALLGIRKGYQILSILST